MNMLFLSQLLRRWQLGHWGFHSAIIGRFGGSLSRSGLLLLLVTSLISNSECFQLLWINYYFRLLGHVEIILLIQHFLRLIGSGRALRKPLEPLDFLDRMDALQIHLLNLNFTWIWRVQIHILIQAERKLVNVELPWLGLVDWIIINLVRQIFEPNQNLVAVNWQKLVSLIIFKLDGFLKLRGIRQLDMSIVLFNTIQFIIKVEEVYGRFLDPQLLRSLLRFGFLGVENLEVVLGVGLDA